MSNKQFERALDLVTVAALVGIAGVMLARLDVLRLRIFQHQSGRHQSNTQSLTYVRGGTVDRLHDVDFGRSDRTLVIFLRGGCQYCIESLPLFREVANDPSRDPKTLQVIVAGLDSLQQTQEFLRQGGVKADRILSMTSEMAAVRAVPTLVLVTRKGVIENVWTGEQPGARQAAILEALSRPGT
jgi:hypothetical protein